MRLTVILLLAGLFATSPLAAATARAAEPWPGDHWRADVEEIKAGHRLHTTMLGTETNAAPGEIIRVICTDTSLSTGTTVTRRAVAHAQTRQDDWEGDAGALGTFGSARGDTLRWFTATPCAAGAMTWQRR